MIRDAELTNALRRQNRPGRRGFEACKAGTLRLLCACLSAGLETVTLCRKVRQSRETLIMLSDF
jgi:hypothetical protein